MKFTALMPHQTLTEEVEEVYVVAASEAWGTHESEFGGPRAVLEALPPRHIRMELLGALTTADPCDGLCNYQSPVWLSQHNCSCRDVPQVGGKSNQAGAQSGRGRPLASQALAAAPASCGARGAHQLPEPPPADGATAPVARSGAAGVHGSCSAGCCA